MDAVYRWVGNIVCYTIFITVLTGILPAGKYEKYIRLFAGCILVLIVFRPLTGGLRLEEQIDSLFRAISFENEAEELRQDLDGMEEKRLDMLVSGYEEEAAGEITRLAEEEGFRVREASVTIERNQDDSRFGKITQVRLDLEENSGNSPDMGMDGGDRASPESGENSPEISVAVEPVKKIGEESETDKPGNGSAEVSADVTGTRTAGRLKDKIVLYYRVEAENVEIQVEQGSGVDKEE